MLGLVARWAAGEAAERRLPKALALTDGSGATTGWRYPDPTGSRGFREFDLSAFSAIPGIGPAIVEAFVRSYPATLRIRTIESAHTSLTRGLLLFLAAQGDIASAEIDRAFLRSFRDDLDRRFAHQRTSSRRPLFLIGQTILKRVCGDAAVEWIDVPYRRSHLEVVPVEPVDDAGMMAILAAAAADTEETIAFDAALRDASHPLWLEPGKIQSLRDAVLLRAEHPDGAPPIAQLQKSDNPALRLIGWYRYGSAVAATYPTPATMVPFVILAIFHLRLNTEDIVSLANGEIRRTAPLGVDRIGVTYMKHRAGKVLSPSVPAERAPGNPARLFDFVEQWTAPLRAGLALNLADLTFVAQGNYQEATGGKTSGLAPKTLCNNIRSYCARLGVDGVTPTRIRKAALRLIDELTGGDRILRMAAAGHRSRIVSERHYPGDADQQSQALAHGFSIAHDFMIGDQRDNPNSRSPGEDHLCITPGWDCSDPFAGVMDGQRVSRRCTAYGRCPVCPCGKPDLGSALSYARCVALLAAIQRAEQNLSRGVWVGVWRPVEVRLRTYWLDRFAPEARLKGATMHVPMPEIRDERHG